MRWSKDSSEFNFHVNFDTPFPDAADDGLARDAAQLVADFRGPRVRRHNGMPIIFITRVDDLKELFNPVRRRIYFNEIVQAQRNHVLEMPDFAHIFLNVVKHGDGALENAARVLHDLGPETRFPGPNLSINDRGPLHRLAIFRFKLERPKPRGDPLPLPTQMELVPIPPLFIGAPLVVLNLVADFAPLDNARHGNDATAIDAGAHDLFEIIFKRH